MLVIDIPLVLPSLSNERMHPMAKAKLVKRQRATTDLGLRAAAVGSRLPVVQPGQKLRVLLVRLANRPIRDHHDNLPTAFKHVVDQIAAYFHIDDSDPRIEWKYAQAKARESSVRVEFEVVADPLSTNATAKREVSRAASSEPDQRRIVRLARPAVVSNRPDDPEAA